MRYISLILLFFFLTGAFFVNAQIYEYRDADGNIRFTDNLGNVPEHLREKITRIQKVPHNLKPSEVPVNIEAPISGADDGQEIADQRKSEVNLLELEESLREEQAELQKEYDNLGVEKELLGDPPIHGASDEDLDAYKARVEEINSRIRNYQERLQEHENRVKNYNARIVE